jgi:hypothetical protein
MPVTARSAIDVNAAGLAKPNRLIQQLGAVGGVAAASGPVLPLSAPRAAVAGRTGSPLVLAPSNGLADDMLVRHWDNRRGETRAAEGARLPPDAGRDRGERTHGQESQRGSVGCCE